jgi:hypothetical protein
MFAHHRGLESYSPRCSLTFCLCFFLLLLHDGQCSKAMHSLRLPAYMSPRLCLRQPRCPSLLPISHPVLAVLSVSLLASACLSLSLTVLSAVANAKHAYQPWLPFVLVQLGPQTPFLTLRVFANSCLPLFHHWVASQLDHFA